MSQSQSLLEEMGLDEQTLSWHQLALCDGMELSKFFEDYEDDKVVAAQMDNVCLSCPVMKECFSNAVRDKDYGLRAAIYFTNGKPDRQHNEHKTEEVWNRIRERLF